MQIMSEPTTPPPVIPLGSPTPPEDVFLVGIKSTVVAMSRANGAILWSTRLPAGLTADFVTVTCDGERVFAHTGGKLFGLDLATGRLLWSNELTGYGYGLATLCVPGSVAAPDSASVRRHIDLERRKSSD